MHFLCCVASVMLQGPGEVVFTDALTDRETRLAPDLKPAYRLALSKDGATLFLGRADFRGLGMGCLVKKLDLIAGKQAKAIDSLHLHFEAMALSPDGALLAIGGGHPIPMGANPGHVALWDIAAHKPRTHFSSVELTQPVHDLAFSRDGRLLVTAGYGQFKLWDVATGKIARRLESGGDYVTAAAFLGDDRIVAAGQESDRKRDRPSVRLWDVKSGAVTDELQGRGHSDAAQSVRVLAVAPKARTFATAAGFGAKAELKLWNLTKELSVLDLKGHKEVQALAFSPDGAILAGAGADGAIKLWSLATGKEKATLRGHVGAVTALLFLPDGGALLSAGQDRTVRRWRIGE